MEFTEEFDRLVEEKEAKMSELSSLVDDLHGMLEETDIFNAESRRCFASEIIAQCHEIKAVSDWIGVIEETMKGEIV